MKFGFACKYFSTDKSEEKLYNFKTTTLRSLSKLSPLEKDTKLRSIYEHNLRCIERLLRWVNANGKGAVRIGSDIFPFLSQYQGDINELYDTLPAARNIIVSTHPDQFFNIGNANFGPEVREQLLEQAVLLELLTSSNTEPGKRACLVLHVGSKACTGPDWIARFEQLPELVRKYLVIENDEFSWGLEDILRAGLHDYVPVVADFHHDWIYRGGLYRNLSSKVDSDTLSTVQQSWEVHNFAFSKIHCSMSAEDELKEWSPDLLPVLNKPKGLLRKHSDMPWNKALVKYYANLCDEFSFDTVMVEMKNKQVAMQSLADMW